MQPDTDSSRLRSTMRLRRAALTADEQRRAGESLVGDLLALPALSALEPGRLAAYWPVRGELDPRPAALALSARGWKLHLPVLEGDSLAFAEWDPDDTHLELNRFGIPEPVSGSRRVPGTQLEAVLVPAVVVDPAGNRLGSGAGYYDRTFAGRPPGGPPLLIAVVHAFQLVEQITAKPWDVAMDLVLSARS